MNLKERESHLVGLSRKWIVLLAFLLVFLLVWQLWIQPHGFGHDHSVPGSTDSSSVKVQTKVELHHLDYDLLLIPSPQGPQYIYEWKDENGQVLRLSPDEHAAKLFHVKKAESWIEWIFLVLNITGWISLIWVILGFGGQIMFTGRMVVQWLVSEKKGQSVVPPLFWWMSLGGASLLIVYFIWRKDIVGVLGQSTGWFIYIRNIVLIYKPKSKDPTVMDDPGPEPELGE